MRTECQFLGNEISVRVFDLLFFLHSSIVSPSTPSEELKNHVYFKRKKHRNSPSLRGDFCWRKLKGEVLSFLAHLSRRLTGELIVYPWSGVRRRPSVVRPSYVVRRPSFTMLKHLLLRNPLADQSQILCGASLGRGLEILFAASGSHDQDGRHAHIW